MGLERLTNIIPPGETRLRLGTVVTVGGVRMVNVDGNNLLATWSDPIVVDDGDPVDVQLFTAGVGQYRVHVSGRTTLQPRPRTGTVTQVPAGSPTITVEANGIYYAATPIYATGATTPYAPDDKVHLDWGAGTPRVVGKVTLAPPPVVPVAPKPPPTPPPPPRPVTGKASAAAKTSRTYWPTGGWGSWNYGGGRVHQGTWGGNTVTGAWFYGTPYQPINDGRKITRFQFRTGRHLNAGASGSKTFHFYAHTNSGQPGGDTNRVAGPFDVVLPQGAAPRWIDLPIAFAEIVRNGGGIAVVGEPYAAMEGRNTQPDSGATIMHWER